MTALLRLFLLLSLIAFTPARADTAWVAPGPDGQPQVQFYFFWSTTCPHCAQAHPHVEALPQARPWLRLHSLEVSRDAANTARFRDVVEQLGDGRAAVPAFAFCGEIHFGWDGEAVTGALLAQRLDACRVAMIAGGEVPEPASPAAERVELPLLGSLDPASLSLPALTLVLAGLDAFNPCAFFVLLFLLSMMAHQKSRARMLLIGGVFVTISGLMYFAFMAAWLSAFQLLGHFAGVTLAAGAVAVVVGLINIKDFFRFKQGVSLSIPDAQKADIIRRARGILSAESLPAMLGATIVLAIAANFYELLCTAGFPMVYTRLLTLADLSPAGRYGYLALYNLIYVVPLAAIVGVFVWTLGARKLSEREGRLLKLMSGLMMLGLGTLLLVAPEAVSHVGVAFGLMAAAVAITFVAAKVGKA